MRNADRFGFSGAGAGWPLLALAAVCGALLIRWTGPLTEIHDFRQSQTAISAFWMARDGINLLRPPLPLFGAEHPSVPLEFPLYQAATALLSRLFGNGPAAIILAARLLNFFFFLVAGMALHRLAKLTLGPARARVALLLFLFMPFTASFAASVSIEYLALACVLFYLEMVWRVAVSGETRPALLALGALAGAGALLCKVTTGLVYMPMVGALWLYWVREPQQRARPAGIVLPTILLGVIPLLLGYLWVSWTDGIKMTSPVSSFFTSAGSATWNYGTWAQRFSLMPWVRIGGFWILQVFAVIGLPLALIGGVTLWREAKWKCLFWLGSLSGILVFFNLYQVHNYYHIAQAPCLMLFMAVGIVTVAPSLRTGPMTAAAVTIVIAWGLFYTQTMVPGYRAPPAMLSAFRGFSDAPTPTRQRDNDFAAVIDAHSDPSAIVYIASTDWSAIVPFMAQRRAFMAMNCGADFAEKPRIGLYAIDRTRSICTDITIPERCRIADIRRFELGNCVEVKPPARN